MAGIDSYTKLMLHCNGIDGSTTIVDSSLSPHSPSVVGDAQLDTAFKKFNTASLLLDGLVDYVAVPDSTNWDFGSFDFAIDTQFRVSDNDTNIFCGRTEGGSNYFYFGFEGSLSTIRFRDYNGSNNIDFSRSVTVSVDTWYHVAVTRDGNNYRLFLNGVQQGATYVNSNAFTNRTVSFDIGAMTQNASYYFNGHIDEFRVSVGDSRWVSNFTPPISEYTEPLAPVEVSDNLSLTEIVTTNVSLIKKVIVENLTLNESVSRSAIIYTIVEEFLTLSDTTTVKQAISKLVTEELKLTEDYEKLVIKSIVDNINLLETINGTPSLIKKVISESIALTEVIATSVLQEVNYATQILHYNPLIFVTNTDPVKMVTVDISTPEIPVKSVYTLTGYSNVSDIALNETNDYFYINVNSAKVLKIEKTNLNNITEIDLDDLDNLLNIDTLDDYFISYASTDDANGEIIKIDEREIVKLNTDIRWLEEKHTILNTRLNTIQAKMINTDFRFLGITNKQIKTDLRWLAVPYEEINQTPISPLDIQIKINGVDLVPINDIDMSTVKIDHLTDEKSTATFRLSRRHDKLNFTNTGVASEITNNNTVEIIINGRVPSEFSGKISNFQADSETETVFIVAKMDTPSDSRHTVNIPMSTLDQNINLYHCMMNNVTSDEPYIDPDDENPEYYKGIKVQLGTRVGQPVLNEVFVAGDPLSVTAEQIQNGTYEFKQGWTHFWFVKIINFVTGVNFNNYRYVGTSLGPISSDTFQIDEAYPRRQIIASDTEEDLGEYTIGSAPYKTISSKNGEKYRSRRYIEKNNRLYFYRPAGYNYIDYAKQVADLEYEKIQNINGDILPIVNASIDVTLDAYYYYNLKLLTRINVSNTTTSDIYKNNNGFPVAIKSISITINTDSRIMVTLQCDNQKSLTELEEIDARYPDEESDEFLFPESTTFLYRKFDLATWKYTG